MVTDKDSTQVVSKRWVNEHVSKVDSRAILILIAVKVTLVWGFENLDYQTKIHNFPIKQKKSKKTVHISFCLNIALTTYYFASKYIWKYLQILNQFGTLNSDFLKLSFSKSVDVSQQRVQSDIKAFFSSFDYIPQVYIWLRLCTYNASNKHIVKYTCITLYNYTVHCTMRARAQSTRWQQRKEPSHKREIVT